MMQPADVDVVPVSGSYRIQKEGRRRGRAHETYPAAETEALRLTVDNPGAVFTIMREIARVHHKGQS
ncbi:hypothetical protein E5673_08975 [Sphingomonas sp. PAMC26645]|uniref:hypothetical protein n=1 Tax=Sphingomonas sp. PAMC26645 TaxID=2565555 RepID=UPI00109DC5C8|nr:hypothetical protein [Sphingomonas sp. PAMC26645]QCB42347.1 hypothetical protein E5673_08975 [Sphingomonas sp. PAMC26645]